MTFIAMFTDGPKAGETMILDSYRSEIYVMDRERFSFPSGRFDTDFVSPAYTKSLIYKPFMLGVDVNMALYSLYRDDPYRPITDVLLPILKIANVETERQRELY
jgi:hypothetical protein